MSYNQQKVLIFQVGYSGLSMALQALKKIKINRKNRRNEFPVLSFSFFTEGLF